MSVPSEKILVCIPTTQGPSLVTGLKYASLTSEDGEPYSVIHLSMELGHPRQLAGIAKAYRTFANGPLAVVDKIVRPASYQLEISFDITDKDCESWNLGVAVAHLLFQEGRLFQFPDNPDLFKQLALRNEKPLNETDTLPAKVLWLTGRVLNDSLKVVKIEGEEDKIKSSKHLFKELGDRIALYFPSESKTVLENLGAGFLNSHHVESDKICYVSDLFGMAQAEGLSLPERLVSQSQPVGRKRVLSGLYPWVKRHPYKTILKVAPILGVLTWFGIRFSEVKTWGEQTVEEIKKCYDTACWNSASSSPPHPQQPPLKKEGISTPPVPAPQPISPEKKDKAIPAARISDLTLMAYPKLHPDQGCRTGEPFQPDHFASPVIWQVGEKQPEPQVNRLKVCAISFKASLGGAPGVQGYVGMLVQSLSDRRILDHSPPSPELRQGLDESVELHDDAQERRFQVGKYRVYVMASSQPLTEVLPLVENSLEQDGTLPALPQVDHKSYTFSVVE